MRFKPVPEPPDTLEELEAIRAAVPATPDENVDCCARLIGHSHVSDRDEAADWLTFLRALELATNGSVGFARTPRDIDAGHLRAAFRERVAGADAVLEYLETTDRPLEVREVSTQLRGRTTVEEPLERAERLLDWAALLGIVDDEEGEYRPR
ncbi:hypothetical protein [Halostagnicola bangensis]